MQATDKLVISSQNPQKLEFLLEMLRNLPEVEVEVEVLPPAVPEATTKLVQQEAEADFWSMVGTWQAGKLDAEELRQQSWQRGKAA